MNIFLCVLGIIVIGTFIGLYVYSPFGIKYRIIKNKHSRQTRAIQAQARNPLKQAKHPMVIEMLYSLTAFFLIGGIFFMELIFEVAMPFFDRDNVYSQVNHPYGIILLYTLVYYLLDLSVFYIRMAKGRIQGVILFDPQEKKIYAFHSLNSDCYLGGYKEYHESELVYTPERDGLGDKVPIADVFFTIDKNEYAFKLQSINGNNFVKMLSHQEPADISIPFKYSYHAKLLYIVSIICGILISFGLSLLVFP